MPEDTYTMVAICKNCGTEHITEIPKGAHRTSHKATCPYCGNNSNHDLTFSYRRPRVIGKYKRKLVFESAESLKAGVKP